MIIDTFVSNKTSQFFDVVNLFYSLGNLHLEIKISYISGTKE